jgi:hypothetical protein
MASAGATITFKTIKTEKGIMPTWVTKPTKVATTWKVKSVGSPGSLASAVKVCKGDGIEWHDSTIDTLDGQSPEVLKIKDAKEFVVDSASDDSSGIDIKDKGYGVISTSFDAHLAQNIKDAGEGAADLFGDSLDFLKDIGITGFIFVFVIIIIILVVPTIIQSFTN